MKLPHFLDSPVATGVLVLVATGLLFYYGGNQPLISQAQQGLNGVISPNAPAKI